MKLTKKKNILLTFDLDWCPDFCIEMLLDDLKKKKVKALFFITHNSKAIEKIKKGGHHIGLHPNFYKNSSQGKDPVKIIKYLLRIAPKANVIRTHRLFYESKIFSEVFKKFKQLKFDMSTHTFKFPKIKLYHSHGLDVSYKKINFNWEDDTAAYENSNKWNFPDFESDNYVFNFHPIYLFLNLNDKSMIIKLNKLLNAKNKSLKDFKRKDLEKIVNQKKGCKDFFNQILNSNNRILSFKKFLKIIS